MPRPNKNRPHRHVVFPSSGRPSGCHEGWSHHHLAVYTVLLQLRVRAFGKKSPFASFCWFVICESCAALGSFIVEHSWWMHLTNLQKQYEKCIYNYNVYHGNFPLNDMSDISVLITFWHRTTILKWSHVNQDATTGVISPGLWLHNLNRYEPLRLKDSSKFWKLRVGPKQGPCLCILVWLQISQNWLIVGIPNMTESVAVVSHSRWWKMVEHDSMFVVFKCCSNYNFVSKMSSWKKEEKIGERTERLA